MSTWMIPEDRLSDEQKHFIDVEIPKNKNQWIKGYAGSGKSVLLVHGIHDLIKKNPEIRICVVVFTHSLKQLFIAGFKELKLPEKNLYICTYHQFKKDNYTFDYIFCDEVQDLPKSILDKMRLNAKYIISGGDSYQSIYEKDPQTGEPAVSPTEIGNILNANSWELKTIYRLTRSLVKVISILMPSMSILSSKTDNTKKDITPNLAKASSEQQEVEYIVSKAKDAIANGGNSVAIILPTHEDIIKFVNIALQQNNKDTWDNRDPKNQNKWEKPDFGKLNNYLRINHLDIEYIGNNYGDLFATGQNGKIIMMTYHSSKGLDFDHVFLPFLSDKSYGYFTETLFMVGMTRSKFQLQISYTGSMHRYVSKIEANCNQIDIDDVNNKAKKNVLDDFDF